MQNDSILQIYGRQEKNLSHYRLVPDSHKFRHSPTNCSALEIDMGHFEWSKNSTVMQLCSIIGVDFDVLPKIFAPLVLHLAHPFYFRYMSLPLTLTKCQHPTVIIIVDCTLFTFVVPIN